MVTLNNFDNNQTGKSCDTSLATSPFTALKAHFGMLLGVADFQTIDAYHRGKQWLHSSWLHRQGVIWGFEVDIDLPSSEIRVSPGLAVDALGRELHLDHQVCLNLPAWLKKYAKDSAVKDAVKPIENTNELIFNAHITIQFKACLSRQVPALMEPCNGGGATSAYSRIDETVEIKVVPGLAPIIGASQRNRPYHHLRVLFGLENAIQDDENLKAFNADKIATQRRNEITALPKAEQASAFLKAMREIAALDCIAKEMQPPKESNELVSNVPSLDPAPLVLANLNQLRLADKNIFTEPVDIKSGDIKLLNEDVSENVDNTVRDTHIATSTIQELLCGHFSSGLDQTDAPPPDNPSPETPATPSPGVAGLSRPIKLESSSPDSGGPRIEPDSIVVAGSEIRMTHTGPKFLKKSLKENESVFVNAYSASGGWAEPEIDHISYNPGAKEVTINFREKLKKGIELRIVLKGTGMTPVLATLGNATRVPLAGEVGGQPGGLHQGNDFIFMIKTGAKQ